MYIYIYICIYIYTLTDAVLLSMYMQCLSDQKEFIFSKFAGIRPAASLHQRLLGLVCGTSLGT